MDIAITYALMLATAYGLMLGLTLGCTFGTAQSDWAPCAAPAAPAPGSKTAAGWGRAARTHASPAPGTAALSRRNCACIQYDQKKCISARVNIEAEKLSSPHPVPKF